mgnify:FL=1
MTAEEFAPHYLAQPEPERDGFECAFRAWRDYYAACDAYDRGVCTGKGRDGAMPRTAWEYQQVATHARLRYQDVRRACAGIDPDVVERAKEVARRRL